MKTTYLCGGIHGLSDSACKDWREYAKQNLKTATLDPMRRDYRGIEDKNVVAIVDNDKIDIVYADFLLVNAAVPSWGTAMEILFAHTYGKTIVAFINPEKAVSPWLRYHCQICTSLEQAVDTINKLAD